MFLQDILSMGKLTLPEIIPQEKLKDALIYKVTLLASVIIQNNGKEGFSIKSLPAGIIEDNSRKVKLPLK